MMTQIGVTRCAIHVILSLLLLLAFSSFTNAIFEEDVGRLDFLISTAGHGAVKYVHAMPDEDLVVTSDAGSTSTSATTTTSSDETSCIIASRKISDGSFVWRRNVCAAYSDASTDDDRKESIRRHIVTALENVVYTVDIRMGVVRAWDIETGSLVWEGIATIPETKRESTSLSIWTYTTTKVDDVVYVALGSESGSDKSLLTVFDAWKGQVIDDEQARSDAYNARQTKTGPNRSVGCSEASSFEIMFFDNGASPSYRFGGDTALPADLGLSKDDTMNSLELLSCSKDSVSILVSTKRGTTKQVTFSVNDKAWENVWTAEEGLAQISSAVLLDASHYVGYDVDPQSEMQLLQFSSRIQDQLNRLTSLFNGVLGKEDASSMSTPGGDETNDIHDRIHVFGFVKIAAIISSSSHRLYGMDTVGKRRGMIRYALDLPNSNNDDSVEVKWHRMVHGAPSSTNAVHGINGGTHNRDVLVLSLLGKKGQEASSDMDMHWMCVDAASGTVHKEGSVGLSSPLAQVIPMVGAMPCRQSALLLQNDGTLITIPSDTNDETASLIESQLKLPQNGFFAHAVNGKDSPASFETFVVSSSNSPGQFQAQLAGSVAFPQDEYIVRVEYPKRDEMIQSPCNILGDDSLLLKYINPHLVVVITMRRPSSAIVEDITSEYKTLLDAIKASSQSKQKTTKQKRKPAGVGEAGQATSSDEVPNLFVNVVDSVSGRILYRASHANAQSSPTPTAVVSENWVYYSFANEKTRRAEIGVLSLYEGMIGSKGLTAFATPEQSDRFSSLDARESKPVVLYKSYSIGKPVTALGVTSTRNGISAKRLVLAGVDGQVYTIDRKSLEPRRPVGELKEHEKKEGLFQYTELIPTIPYMSLCSNRTVDSVKGIITAPTDLESQSLVLAYGGPDIFFTRTSPSRGFDLLPDSFNRVLLSMITVALLAVLIALRQRVSKKFQKQGWS